MTERELGQVEYRELESDRAARIGAPCQPDRSKEMRDWHAATRLVETMGVAETHQRLGAMVLLVLSLRCSVLSTAESLTLLCRTVELLLRQIELITKTIIELAYHFRVYAPDPLRCLEDKNLPDHPRSLEAALQHLGHLSPRYRLNSIQNFRTNCCRTQQGVSRLNDHSNLGWGSVRRSADDWN